MVTAMELSAEEESGSNLVEEMMGEGVSEGRQRTTTVTASTDTDSRSSSSTQEQSAGICIYRLYVDNKCHVYSNTYGYMVVNYTQRKHRVP